MDLLGGVTVPRGTDHHDGRSLLLLSGAILFALAGAICGCRLLRAAHHRHLPGGHDTVYALAGGQSLQRAVYLGLPAPARALIPLSVRLLRRLQTCRWRRGTLERTALQP